MKLFLAGISDQTALLKLLREFDKDRVTEGPLHDIYVLESFVYANEDARTKRLISTYKGFILDSGAFTFMLRAKKQKVSLDWDKYIEDYADFIKEFSIKHFFELDVDVITGIKTVERLRKKLESLTGKQCIPVWHRSRGLDYWKGMCSDYKYISISASGKNGSTNWLRRPEGRNVIAKMINNASDNGIKVHGLGYTPLEGLRAIRFYSVDSTSWFYGNVGGYVYVFDGQKMAKIMKPKGTRLVSKTTYSHSFLEWVKYQRFAETHL